VITWSVIYLSYLDGELELTRQLALEAHLAACSTCKNAAEEPDPRLNGFSHRFRRSVPLRVQPLAAGISPGSIISFILGLSEAEMEELEDLLRAQADSSGPLNDVGLQWNK
jgi:Putative zinc-finger